MWALYLITTQKKHFPDILQFNQTKYIYNSNALSGGIKGHPFLRMNEKQDVLHPL